MQAVLLAAGVGRRLASLKGEVPKCLLEFEGRSLLLRHLDHLLACGIDRLTVVVGHRSDAIIGELEAFGNGVDVATVFNANYREGSIISLLCGLRGLQRDHDAILMDADVLYDVEVLQRLVRAPFRNGFLLDPRSSASGEEMMLGARGGRVQRITRNLGKQWEVIGEGVGFFKICAEDMGFLLAELERLVDEGQRNADYEQAIDAFLVRRPAGYVSVADLPWTEIDFDEDVERAQRVILPAIRARRSSPVRVATL